MVRTSNILMIGLVFICHSSTALAQFGQIARSGHSLADSYIDGSPVLINDGSSCAVAHSLRQPEQFASQIHLDPAITTPMLDFQNRQSDKELFLLNRNFEGSNTYPQVIVGAQFRASAIFGRTNAANRFPYLGRFPTDFSGTTVTDARLLQANQALVAHVNPWTHGYVETLFSDVFSFNAPKQGSFQVRQAFVLFGDQSRSPWYAFVGKKNVSFGDFETLSPFTQAVPWHYFAPLAEGVGGGLSLNGFDLSVMVLNGSRGIRVTDSSQKGHLNNFAVNARQTVSLGPNRKLILGAGYLYGSIYDGLTAEHTDPTITGERNGVWDAHAKLQLGIWDFRAELVQTEQQWPVTGRQVTAYVVETAVQLPTANFPLRMSGSWSEGIQGNAGTEFEFNRQLVIGLQHRPSPGLQCSLEYVRSTGFAPLIGITTASDRDVVQNSVVLGVTLSL